MTLPSLPLKFTLNSGSLLAFISNAPALQLGGVPAPEPGRHPPPAQGRRGPGSQMGRASSALAFAPRETVCVSVTADLASPFNLQEALARRRREVRGD